MDDASNVNDVHSLRISTAGRPGEVLLMKVAGYLDAANFDRLEKALEEALDEGRSRVILDLAGLNYINSAGVGVILAAISRARSVAGDIVLVNPTRGVAVVFDLVGMSKFSHIVDTVEDAEGLFHPPTG